MNTSILLRLTPALGFLALCIGLLAALYGEPEGNPNVGKPLDLVAFNALPELYGEGAPIPVDGPVVYNLFASWCSPCLKELPALIAFSKQHNIPIIGIAFQDKPDHTREWLERHGNPFTQVRVDRKGHASMGLSIAGLPQTFVVKDGIITAWHSGIVDEMMLNDMLLKLP